MVGVPPVVHYVTQPGVTQPEIETYASMRRGASGVLNRTRTTCQIGQRYRVRRRTSESHDRSDRHSMRTVSCCIVESVCRHRELSISVVASQLQVKKAVNNDDMFEAEVMDCP